MSSGCIDILGDGEPTKFHDSISNKFLLTRKNEMRYTKFMKRMLKGPDHVTINKPVMSIIYIVSHTYQLCSAQSLMDGVNPQ